MRKQQEGVALQESEAQNEIAPEDVKYRLGTLPKAPLELQRLSYFSQPKPPWIHLSTTYGEGHKPWTYYGEEPSHSGEAWHGGVQGNRGQSGTLHKAETDPSVPSLTRGTPVPQADPRRGKYQPSRTQLSGK